MVISSIRSCRFVAPPKLIYVLVLWMLFAQPGRAQEAGYVDARGSSKPKQIDKAKKGQTPGQCGDNCTLERPFAFQLVKMDLGSGSVDWTIRLGNQSSKPIRVPSSITRAESTVESSTGHRVVLDMSIVVYLSCATPASARRVPVEVNLYGAPEGSTGMTTLDPGQWITIVGRADTCNEPGKDHDAYSFNVNVSLLDTYRAKDKEVEEVSPVYAGIDSGSILWDGPGEMTWNRDPLSYKDPSSGWFAPINVITGTQDGPFNGIPATGKKIKVGGMQISKFNSDQKRRSLSVGVLLTRVAFCSRSAL